MPNFPIKIQHFSHKQAKFRHKKNALAFSSKHKCVFPKTSLRFTSNARTFKVKRKGVFQRQFLPQDFSQNFTRIRNTFPGLAAHPTMASAAPSGGTMREISSSAGQLPVFI